MVRGRPLIAWEEKQGGPFISTYTLVVRPLQRADIPTGHEIAIWVEAWEQNANGEYVIAKATPLLEILLWTCDQGQDNQAHPRAARREEDPRMFGGVLI